MGLKEFPKIFEVKLPEVIYFGLKTQYFVKINFKLTIFLINRVSSRTYPKVFLPFVYSLQVIDYGLNNLDLSMQYFTNFYYFLMQTRQSFRFNMCFLDERFASLKESNAIFGAVTFLKVSVGNINRHLSIQIILRLLSVTGW